MPIVSKRILSIPAKTDWPVPALHGTRWTGADGNTYATIIGNPDGTPFTVAGASLFVAVIDARYRRPGLPWNLYNVSLPTLTNCWSYGSDVYLTAGMTETEIDGLSFILDENHSSAFNSDVLVANAGTIDVFGNTGCPQANYCHSISLASGYSQAFLVPSGPILARIWMQRALLDSLDPTVSSFPAYALSNWGFGETPGTIFASSQYNAGYAITVKSDGKVFYNLKYEGVHGCLPILEIEA